MWFYIWCGDIFCGKSNQWKSVRFNTNGNVLWNYYDNICWVEIKLNTIYTENMVFRYGDLAPVTATGRALACVMSVFGITILSMLASVLVDRYQRVYSRKRFFNDENVEEITLTNSMARSSISGKSRQTTPNFESIRESYKEHEQCQQTDQLSGKVRFIAGSVSDNEENHQKTSSNKIVQEVQSLNSK